MLISFLPIAPSCRALALNCDAPLNDKDGAESKNWRAGKPVRVVRSSKGRRISKYAPEEGNRYDGIYKVWVHYFGSSEMACSTLRGTGHHGCVCVATLGGQVLARDRKVRLSCVAVPAEAGRFGTGAVDA